MDRSLEDNKSPVNERREDAADVSPLEKRASTRPVANVEVLSGSESSEARLRALVEKLYPALDLTDRKTAVANLRRYCEVALAVVANQNKESKNLTGPKTVHTMEERSNVHLKE
jgi:hypothetical protein